MGLACPSHYCLASAALLDHRWLTFSQLLIHILYIRGFRLKLKPGSVPFVALPLREAAVDATHRFNVDPDGSAGVPDAGRKKEEIAPLSALTDEQQEAQPDPSSALWNSRPDTGKWLAGLYLDGADSVVRYRIQGWLAEQGTSVWFGAGSTGKTQLMLWMAAMLASRPEDRPEQTWLGGRIHGTGHVLILTAEDTREQIMGRLKDVITHSMKQCTEARLRTCARLHIMPFLSMPEKEFDHPNPSLFQQSKDRSWETTEVLKEVRRYISEWNRLHEAAEDKIIGVVMDSATSMSGFDSLDAQATTNFFFYLGRLCERLRLFWAIIGHTPKTTLVARNTYRATAASRLRGVAMWTTAPRLTVEVRLVQDWKERGKTEREAKDVRDWLGDLVKREDLLVVYVAKANLKGATREERYLARLPRGAFADVTDKPDEVLWSGMLDREGDDAVGGISTSVQSDENRLPDGVGGRPSFADARSASPGRPKLDVKAFEAGTDLVLELIHETYPSPCLDKCVSANRLMAVLDGKRVDEPRAKLVTSASGGGKLPARLGAINWHLGQLEARGVLQKVGRHFHLFPSSSGWPGNGGAGPEINHAQGL